ncbi:MAG: MBL fold metallo-hydrolase [Bacteroidota bacterium]
MIAKNNQHITVTFLGTGTSQGVPVIGCDCPVCTSSDPRDKRLRTSILVTIDDKNIVVDAGPDFRQQMLRAGVSSLSAILLTHQHNDHVIGLDDVRPFNFRQGTPISIYATPMVQADLRQRFAYAFDTEPYPGAPRLELVHLAKQTSFELLGERILPIEVMHGKLAVMGFRIRDFTYLTDMNAISDVEYKKVIGTRILVVDALHHTPHHSHFTLEQAIDFATKVDAEQTYFIHASHRMGQHAVVEKTLPEGMYLSYDGLKLHLG